MIQIGMENRLCLKLYQRTYFDMTPFAHFVITSALKNCIKTAELITVY